MQALPSDEVANEGARAFRKVNLERFKAKLRDQYLEGKGVDASQALAEAMGSIQEAQAANRTPTRHGCSTPLEVSAWPDFFRKALERGLFCPLELEDPDNIFVVGDIKEMLRASQNPWHQEALLEAMPELEAPLSATGRGRDQPMSSRTWTLRTASCPLSSGQ